MNFVSDIRISLMYTATVQFEQAGWCLDVTNYPLKTMFLFQFWPIYQAATHQALALMFPLTVIIIRPSDKMRPVQNTKRLMSWAEITFDLCSIRYLEIGKVTRKFISRWSSQIIFKINIFSHNN